MPVLLVVMVAIGAVAPLELAPVPFREEISAPLAVVLVSMPACLLTFALRRPSVALERLVWRLVTRRAAWFSVCLASLAAVTALVMSTRGESLTVMGVRNTLLLAAISTSAALVMPPPTAWVPGVAYAGACLTYGTDRELGPPQAWALLMQGHQHPLSWGLTLGLVLLAGTLYAWRDLSPPRA